MYTAAVSDTTAHPVVLYGRVSQVRDERSKSVDDQLAELRRWAHREGWPILAECRDDDVSASRYANGKARPGWEQAMNVVTSGQVRALLVWEFSRSTRDLRVFTALEEACRAHRVRLGYSGRVHDLSTADGGFSAGLDALLAAKESAMTSERVQRAVESRAAGGRPHGTVPYGYRRTFGERTGKVTGREIDPEQGPIVAEIVTRLLDSEPAHAIAADLNRRGVPTAAAGRCAPDCGCRAGNGRPDPEWTGKHTTVSGRWTGGNLAKVALRPAYAGLRTHHGQVLDEVTAQWPPIIGVDDHHRLRALFGSPERDRFRNSTAVKHLGTGVFRCGRDGCDGRMRVVVQTGRPNRYDCRGCHRVSRHQDPVDDYVEQVIVERLSRPDVLELLSGPDDGQRRQAAAEVAALRADEAEMRRLVRAGRVTPVDLADWRDGWAPRMRAAEAAAQPPQLPGAIIDMAGPDAAARWADATITTKRAVLDTLLAVTILPAKRDGRPFDESTVDIRPKTP